MTSFSENYSESDSENDTEGNESKGVTKPARKNVLSLSDRCNDPEVNMDAKFLDDFEEFIGSHQTSKLFTPFISQMKSVHQKARRSVKKRIDQKLIVSDLNTILAYSLVSSEYVCV